MHSTYPEARPFPIWDSIFENKETSETKYATFTAPHNIGSPGSSQACFLGTAVCRVKVKSKSEVCWKSASIASSARSPRRSGMCVDIKLAVRTLAHQTSHAQAANVVEAFHKSWRSASYRVKPIFCCFLSNGLVQKYATQNINHLTNEIVWHHLSSLGLQSSEFPGKPMDNVTLFSYVSRAIPKRPRCSDCEVAGFKPLSFEFVSYPTCHEIKPFLQFELKMNNNWLVVSTILKNISQWEGLSHIWNGI